MAQMELSPPSLSDVGGSTQWERSGAVGESPIDIWSRLPTSRAPQPTMTVTRATNQTDVEHVLAAWRAAERRLHDLVGASPLRTMVRTEVARARAEYHRLFALAMR